MQACGTTSDDKAAQHNQSVQLSGQCRTYSTAIPIPRCYITDTSGHLRQVYCV